MKKNRVIIMLTTLTVSAAVILFGLFSFRAGERKINADETFFILFVPGSETPMALEVERGIRLKAAELNMDLVVADYPESAESDGQPGTRNQADILKAYSQAPGLDLIIISPSSPTRSLEEPLLQIRDGGLPVITIGEPVPGILSPQDESFPVSHIAFEDHAGGRSAAEYLVKLLNGMGDIYINSGNPDSLVKENRTRGFYSAISEHPSMRVQSIDYCFSYENRARDQTISALMTYPDIKAIYLTNSLSAKGALRAITDTGLTGAVKVALWDDEFIMEEHFRQGEIDLLLLPDGFSAGAAAVDIAQRFLSGDSRVPAARTAGIKTRRRLDIQ